MSQFLYQSPPAFTFGATADLTALSVTLGELSATLQPTKPSALQLKQGDQVAGYQLENEIGKGAYGTVWGATQISTQQRVAIKLLNSGGGKGLQREVDRILELSEHPFVVPLLDAQLQADPPYLVTARMQGSLGGFMRQVGNPTNVQPSLLKLWMGQVAKAMQVMHQSQIVHCDLKPDNILLDDQGNCRVCDFGQAALVDQAGTSLGTYFFMSPNQSKAALETCTQPQPQWDIYSFGATFYYLACGELPRNNNELRNDLGRETDARKRLHLYTERLKATQLRPMAQIGCSLEYRFQEIIERCLMLENGYSSFHQVLDDLENISEPSHRKKPATSFAWRHFWENLRQSLLGKLFSGQTVELAEIWTLGSWICALLFILIYFLKRS